MFNKSHDVAGETVEDEKLVRVFAAVAFVNVALATEHRRVAAVRETLIIPRFD